MLGNMGIQAASQPLLNGLIGWWRFNGNANDSSKTGYNGSVFGATLTEDRFGAPNKAYSFSGAPQYIARNNATALNLTDDFTLSAWIKPTDYRATGYFGLKNGIIVKGPATTYNYGVQVNSATSISFIKRTGSESIQYRTFNDISSLTNVWSLITMVITGGHINLYINGTYINQVTVSNISPGANDSLYIGTTTTSVAESAFIGSLDDIRIYNRVLSTAEINTLYSATRDI